MSNVASKIWLKVKEVYLDHQTEWNHPFSSFRCTNFVKKCKLYNNRSNIFNNSFIWLNNKNSISSPQLMKKK
jgi:hypothetical protein